ncbi:hypothetical protein SAMN04490356_0537 [Streptomyces melanosporofaciens]|uniref:Uncharacterized protein n=2 Tax=Streptomyces melanosporofaciens TaxID=67327 RepID=A0A1H4KC04_STRMJ|nr:hypothetical protein SAMN04490356_0537 [Streptomyces melanosporofaciens]
MRAMAASVRGIVTPLIAEHVPHERELLEYVQPLDDDAITRLFTRPDSDELLGFGVAEVASLITPVVWLVVNEFVTRGAGVAADGFFARIRARFSRTPARGTGVAVDPVPLTPEQQKAVYQRVYDEACLRGLEEAAAKQLGEAVVARLAMGPSGQ